MLGAVFLATVVVAFIAGIVALAMPCCFTVLLPSYMAKSFDSVAGRLGMTAVFGAGIATVLLPIAMGVSYVSTFITLNHPLLFIVGGFFMVTLGLLTLWGVSILPQMNVGLDLTRKDVPSVYALGVFGGVASSCCAPVLAGVLVLTVLSGTWLSALVVGSAYVVGMVFPLFLVAIAWDRKSASKPASLRGRLVRLRFFGWDQEIHSSKLIAGGLFLAMGVVTIVLGVADRMLSTPGSDLFGIYQTSLEHLLISAFSNLLVAVVIGGAILIGAIFGLLRIRRLRREPKFVPSRLDSGDVPAERPPHAS